MNATTTTQTALDRIVSITVTTPEVGVIMGSVGTVEYRDTVGGVHLTAHRALGSDAFGPTTDAWWIVRHADEFHANGDQRHDTDGPAVAVSHFIDTADALNHAWAEVRNSLR